MSSYSRPDSGFTLVELAIVLTVIGLLVGALLVGRETVQNAKITLTVQNAKSYDSAFAAFFSAYRGIPGDIPRPDNIVPNCTTAQTYAPDCLQVAANRVRCSPSTNANGDGLISHAWEREAWSWQLELLNLGKVCFNGGLVRQYAIQSFRGTNPTAVVEDFVGHILDSRAQNAESGSAYLTPQTMEAIDLKFDDGRPYTGEIRSYDGIDDDCIDGDGNYNLAVTTPVCRLAYRLQF